MEKQKIFRECTLDFLEKTFGLEEMDNLESLQSWLSGVSDIPDSERQTLVSFQNLLRFNVHDWNEPELDRHFIGPVLSLVNYSSKKFNLFSERLVEGIVEDWRLYGKPDCFIASGRRSPDKPYFAFQEYKKLTDPDGDPQVKPLRQCWQVKRSTTTNCPCMVALSLVLLGILCL